MKSSADLRTNDVPTLALCRLSEPIIPVGAWPFRLQFIPNSPSENNFEDMKGWEQKCGNTYFGIIHPNPGKKSDLYSCSRSLTNCLKPLSFHADAAVAKN